MPLFLPVNAMIAEHLHSRLPPPPYSPPGDVLPHPPLPPGVEDEPMLFTSIEESDHQWSCTACTLLNHPALVECECCGFPKVTNGVFLFMFFKKKLFLNCYYIILESHSVLVISFDRNMNFSVQFFKDIFSIFLPKNSNVLKELCSHFIRTL